MKYGDYLNVNKHGMYVTDTNCIKELSKPQRKELEKVRKQINQMICSKRRTKSSLFSSQQEIPMQGKGIRSASFYRG